MMKKFLIFMLVLGMASLASANLQLKVNLPGGGETWDPYNPEESLITLQVGQTLLLSVNSMNGTTGDDWFVLGSMVALGDVNTNTGVTHIPPAPTASMLLGDAIVANGVVGLVPGYNGIVGAVGDFVLFPPYANGIYFDQIIFTCRAPGDVTISLLDLNEMTGVMSGIVWDSVIVHQVPEPATIALLGLGGLLLRRRK